MGENSTCDTQKALLGVTKVKDKDQRDKALRFRRKKGKGEGVSEELYQKVRALILKGELSPTVAAIKKAARSTTRAYLIIDRLQLEHVVRQADNGRYRVT